MEETEIIQIGESLPFYEVVANIVFVHGLGGHVRDTWSTQFNNWQDWIKEDLNKSHPVNVWSLGYPTSIVNSLLISKDNIKDRAKSLLHRIESSGISSRPVIFVAHSLGGIMVKWMLKLSRDVSHYENTLLSTKAVLFLATPHKGSKLADLGRAIPDFFKGQFTRELHTSSPSLKEAQEAYLEISEYYKIKTYAFYEKKSKFGIIPIVSKENSNPEIAGLMQIGIDADHNSIAKLDSKDNNYLDYFDPIKKCIEEQPVFQQTHFSSFDTGYKFKHLTELFGNRMYVTKKIIHPLEKAFNTEKKADHVDSKGLDSLKNNLNISEWMLHKAASSIYDLDRIILYLYQEYKTGIDSNEKTLYVRTEFEKLKGINARNQFSLIPLYYALRALKENALNGHVELKKSDFNLLTSITKLIEYKNSLEWNVDFDLSTRNVIMEIKPLIK